MRQVKRWLNRALCGAGFALGALYLAACAQGGPPPQAPLAEMAPARPTATAEPSATPRPAPSATAYRSPEHLIGIRLVDGQAEFYDRRSDKKFIPRGANYVFVPAAGGVTNQLLKVGIYDPARTRTDFARLAAVGYNTVRVFIDHCGAGEGCIGAADGDGLNPAYLDNLADLISAAKEARLFLLLTSNDLPDQGGYAQEANSAAGVDFAGYRNSYYLTPAGVNATRRYWRDLLGGLLERRAALDAVLGWELVNEQWMFNDQPPLSLSEGTVTTTTGSYAMSDPAEKARMVSDGLVYYIAQVKAEILALDPTGLETMGFFAPGVAPGWYVDTTPLLDQADLDFFDFHAYPGGQPLDELASAFGIGGYERKPVILGEYGAFRHIYGQMRPAARALSAWAADACSLGFDGWLYWAYNAADATAGDRTWALTDEDGYLLDLFSPNNQPDVCRAVRVASDNLAFGKPVTVSRDLPAEMAAFAVDENDGSQWGSGALPPQWIEVDLQGVFRVSEIRLMVAQWPAGETLHRVLVRQHGSQDFIQVHEFKQNTKDGDWLVFRPETPIENVEAIRIRTISSPSWVAWKEIQVRGEAETP